MSTTPNLNADADNLLEVRDLLFARLLQYRAFKHVAELFAELEAAIRVVATPTQQARKPERSVIASPIALAVATATRDSSEVRKSLLGSFSSYLESLIASRGPARSTE